MKLTCPFCKSGRHKTQGDGCANCLRCEKTYYFELTPGGKRYRYFCDEGKNNLLRLKDADPADLDDEFKIPPGMILYGCKHPVTREYVQLVAKSSIDAMAQLGWEETPGKTTWIMPIKVGKELKPEKEHTVGEKDFSREFFNELPPPKVPKKVEKPAPKKKREGPTLKQEILSQHIIGKERFLEGTFLILKTRAEADGKPVDEDHLKKRAKLYFSMYRKELGL